MATKTMGRTPSYTESHYETHAAMTHPLISWRSIIAGLIIGGFITDICLMLGLGLGGVTLKSDANMSAQAAGVVGGIWFLVSCMIGLFCGSYFSARVSKLHTSRLAGSQGVLITALFFIVMAFGLSSFVGFIGTAAGGAAQTAANAAAQNPSVQQQASSVNQNEIANQVDKLKAQVSANSEQVKNNAGDAMQAIGWSMFVSMVLGALAAFGGGSLAAYRNVRRPLLVNELGSNANLAGATV